MMTRSRMPEKLRSSKGPNGAFSAALVAILSWLGLPLCSNAQQTPTQGTPSQPAPQEPAPQEPSAVPLAVKQGITDMLRVLDTAFAEADLAAYLAAFAPDHPGAHALLGQRLQRMFPRDENGAIAKNPFRRTSTIIGEPRRVGPRTVARVRYAMHADDKQLAVELEDSIMAFRIDGAGAPVPTFVVDTPRQIDCPPGDVFRCPPCNYEIGGVSGWLCVPMGRDRAQALEASSFYLLGTDLACDVSVRIDEEPRTPIALVEELATILRQVEPAAVAGLATSWLPPSQPDSPKTPDLAGARIEVSLPATNSASEGSTALFHAVQLGSLQHLILVRGSKAAVRAHGKALDDLLASFRILEPNAERAVAGARARKFHVGGTIEGSAYDNRIFRVTLSGPDQWTAQQRCGGAAFRVVWTGPSGARMWLMGFTVPPGMVYWCDQTANQWLRQLCDDAKLTLPDEPREGVTWQPDGACEASTRTIHCTMEHDAKDGSVPGKSKRVLRVAFRDDLLVIVDGAATTAKEWEAVFAAFATLRL